MKEEREEKEKEQEKGKEKEKVVFMWGYLPGTSPQRSPLLLPTVVHMPESANGDTWKDVCGGGCGFAVAISESGKVNTWGSTDDLGQSYVTSGKHEETPEPFLLPTESAIVKAAAGWAHCAAVTDSGDVYTWGWKECVPSGKVVADQATGGILEKDLLERQSGLLSNQVSPKSQAVNSASRSTSASGYEQRGGEEGPKRRRLSTAKQVPESSTAADEPLSAVPCLVTLNPGVRVATVAAGGRHTLALSDIGQVWGWGYGGEGQLGLGSRIRMVSSPHPIPCIETSSFGRDRLPAGPRGSMALEGQVYKVPGSHVKAIACGGRHSAAITDAGALLTFGWGLYGQDKKCRNLVEIGGEKTSNVEDEVYYNMPHSLYAFSFFIERVEVLFAYYGAYLVQCGQGSTDDELSPTCVSSLLGIQINEVAAGLWHTICCSVDGDIYAFGGNQFGQLGTGGDQAEIIPRLLDAPSLENTHVKIVSCGARHSAAITEDGKVFSWGWNKYGQLGLDDVIDRNTPSQVSFDIACLPKNVACGWWHTLALAESPT